MYYSYAYSIHRENMCGTDMPIVQWSILCQKLCKNRSDLAHSLNRNQLKNAFQNPKQNMELPDLHQYKHILDTHLASIKIAKIA